ncbi:MAG: hypothetical protein IKO49_07580 [Bacilli bacterium]|nr:hypothetical protein [Bacilli bacterium]
MYYRLIEKNINKLTWNITFNFFKKKNIDLTEEEARLLTTIAKKNWRDLYNKKYEESFNIIKEKLSKDKKDKIIKIYFETINQYLN